jgi:lauroyl/myristoyl acyltransferase
MSNVENGISHKVHRALDLGSIIKDTVAAGSPLLNIFLDHQSADDILRLTESLSNKAFTLGPYVPIPLIQAYLSTTLANFEAISSSDQYEGGKTTQELARESLRGSILSSLEILQDLTTKPDAPSSPFRSMRRFEDPHVLPPDVEAFAKGGKGVLVHIHSGNFLLPIPLFIKYLTNRKVGVFMEDSLPTRLRESLKNRIIENGGIPLEHERKTVRQILTDIKSTDFVVTAIDRPPKNVTDAVPVKFFGKDGQFMTHVASIAFAGKRPVLPTAVVKKENGAYTLVFGKVLHPEDFKRHDLQALTQAVISEFEKLIAQNPESFYLFEKIFVEKGNYGLFNFTALEIAFLYGLP